MSPQQVVGENATQFSSPMCPYGMRERGIPALVTTFSFKAARACRSYVDGVLSRSARTSRTTFKWSPCMSVSHFTRRALGRDRVWLGTRPWYSGICPRP